MTMHSTKTCLGCDKPFKRPTVTGYCSVCFHSDTHGAKSTYSRARWNNGTAKLQNWRNQGIDLSPEDVAHFDAQTRCNFCDTPFEPFAGAKNLDHDHETMRYRGALCRCCNTSLGKLGDQLETVMERLFSYLRRSRNPTAN